MAKWRYRLKPIRKDQFGQAFLVREITIEELFAVFAGFVKRVAGRSQAAVG